MNEFWLIEESYLRPYLDKIYNSSPEDIEKAIEKAGDFIDDLMKDPVIYTVEGDTATIIISGVMTVDKPSFFARLFGFGGTQYQQIIDSIQMAEDDISVTNIDVFADTPGGTVKGADITNRAFASAKKPIRVINTGMLASAGAYVTAPANRILALEPTSMTGSIGVIVSSISFKEMDKRMGIERIEIRSSNAQDKAPSLDTEHGKDLIQERLDSMENVFHMRYSEGRGLSIEKIKEFKGGMFIAQNPDGMDAIKAGMIDGMLEDEAEIIEGSEEENTIQESTSNEDENINNSLQMGKEILTVNDFEKFLSENPNAKAIYDRDITTAKAEGKKDAETAQAAVVAKVSPILASEKYDSVMKEQAVKALSGEMSVDSFMSVVSMEDMRLERAKGSEAETETENLEETQGDESSKEGKTGKLETAEDMKASADLMMEVG